MRSIDAAVRRRSERGTHRDPDQVLAAVYRTVGASAQDDALPAAPTQPGLRAGDPLLTPADPLYASKVSQARLPRRHLVGVAAALLMVGLTGLIVAQNPQSDAEVPMAAEPESSTPEPGLPSETPEEPLPDLDGYLPAERVPAVEVLHLEDGYSLQAAWESDLCISTRHGSSVASACAPPEYLNDALIGITSHLGDRPGYFLSGAVGPEVIYIRAAMADGREHTIPVVSHPAFEDIQFFLLYIAPGERLEDLRSVTRNRGEHPVMDVDQLATLVDRVEEHLGE